MKHRPVSFLLALLGAFASFASTAPVCALPAARALAPQTIEDATLADVDPFASAIDSLRYKVKTGTFVGAAAVVEIAGERVFEQAIGFCDREADAPMELDTIFRIYSMSKPITGVAAMILVEAGKLELDAPASKYLPDFEDLKVGVEVVDPATRESVLEHVPAEREMTVRDLMRHTSGLTYGIFGNSAVDRLVVQAGAMDPDQSLEDLVRKLGTLPLKHQPGARFEYSLSTDVLGRVIEVVSGERFDDFLEAHVFAPLGMVDTGFSVPKEKRDRVAQMYRRMSGELEVSPLTDPTVHPKFLSGGAGLFSTADDYLRFARMLLGEGKLGKTRILAKETVREMTRDQLGDAGGSFLLGGGTFGLNVAIVGGDCTAGPSPGTFWWEGLAGTGFWIDPVDETIGVFMIQNMSEAGVHSRAFQLEIYRVMRY